MNYPSDTSQKSYTSIIILAALFTAVTLLVLVGQFAFAPIDPPVFSAIGAPCAAAKEESGSLAIWLSLIGIFSLATLGIIALLMSRKTAMMKAATADRRAQQRQYQTEQRGRGW